MICRSQKLNMYLSRQGPAFEPRRGQFFAHLIFIRILTVCRLSVVEGILFVDGCFYGGFPFASRLRTCLMEGGLLGRFN